MTVSKPTGRQFPGLKLDVMVGIEQLSVAVGSVHLTTAQLAGGVVVDGEALTVMFCGHPVKTGAVVSTAQIDVLLTVTAKEHKVEFLEVS